MKVANLGMITTYKVINGYDKKLKKFDDAIDLIASVSSGIYDDAHLLTMKQLKRIYKEICRDQRDDEMYDEKLFNKVTELIAFIEKNDVDGIVL